MLCFNCCFRHEYDAASTAAASVRYRRVVGNEEEKIRRVKTRNKGRAMRGSDIGAALLIILTDSNEDIHNRTIIGYENTAMKIQRTDCKIHVTSIPLSASWRPPKPLLTLDVI